MRPFRKVSFMENQHKYHGVAPTQDELVLALRELEPATAGVPLEEA